jgi:uncharacterized phage protein (TIGR01671 family)
MREIKFRAMTKPPKDFGSYKFSSKMLYGTGVLQDPHNTWLIDNDNTKSLAVGTVKHIVKLETIGQYTGLNDSNGKEIYEGDIVEKIYGDREGCIKVNGSIKPFLYFVEEKYGCSGITPMFPELIHPDDRRWIPIYDQEDEELKTEYLTVVGNIYENPELIP